MDNLQYAVNTFDTVALIGSEYCPGYTDILGVWNSGFFCPGGAGEASLYCCGSALHRYCCPQPSDQVPKAGPGVSVVTVIGMTVVVSTLLLLTTIISCICCPQCPNYDKSSTFYKQQREMRIYRLNTGESAGSAATKSLSMSNGSPSPVPVMTELRDTEAEARLSRRVGAGHYGTLGREQMYRHRADGHQVITGDMTGAQMSHSYTLPHSLSHHSSFRMNDSHNLPAMTENVKYGTVGRKPREQPPAYHILPRASYLVLPPGETEPSPAPDLLQDHDHNTGARAGLINIPGPKLDIIHTDRADPDEEDIYISTKF